MSIDITDTSTPTRVRIVATGVPLWKLVLAREAVELLDGPAADAIPTATRERVAGWAEGVLLDEADTVVEVIYP